MKSKLIPRILAVGTLWTLLLAWVLCVPKQATVSEEPKVRNQVCSTPLVNVRNYGADGSDFEDDTQAIQEAIARARLMVRDNDTCVVKVLIPSGFYYTRDEIWVPSNIWLSGEGAKRTVLIGGEPEGHVIQLGEYRTLCGKTDHVRVSDLSIVRPSGELGSCITASNGVDSLELLNLHLKACPFYGIGFQRNKRCASPDPMTRVTVKNVGIEMTGSDGIDLKQGSGSVNHDMQFIDVCIQNIGWAVDNIDPTLAGLDLAGEDILVKGYWINNEWANVRPGYIVHGIRTRAYDRHVKNMLVTDSMIRGTDFGIYMDGGDYSAKQVTVRSTLIDRVVSGIALRGSGHLSEDVCVHNAIRLVDDLSKKSRFNVGFECETVTKPESCSYFDIQAEK